MSEDEIIQIAISHLSQHGSDPLNRIILIIVSDLSTKCCIRDDAIIDDSAIVKFLEVGTLTIRPLSHQLYILIPSYSSPSVVF